MRGTRGTQDYASPRHLVFCSLFPDPCSLLFEDEIDDFRLADVKAVLGFEDLAHLDAVKLLVALGARTPNGGTS
jgi:hypothetical protein